MASRRTLWLAIRVSLSAVLLLLGVSGSVLAVGFRLSIEPYVPGGCFSLA